MEELPREVVSVAFGASGLAEADSIKFCFTAHTGYSDNGFTLPDRTTTEDTWTTDDTRLLRGARIVAKIGTTTYFDGPLGDGHGTGDPGSGCTATMVVPNANSTYTFYHYSLGGKVDNDLGGQHTVNVRHIDDPVEISTLTTAIPYSHSGGQGTFTVELQGPSFFETMLRLQTTSLLVAWRVGDWADSNTFDVWRDERESAVNEMSNGNVYITTSGTSRKFLIGHEMGHAVDDLYAGATFSADCDYNDTQCPASDHSMTSKEYQTCAFQEGLAHAFSAFVWNATAESDCVFRYWSGYTVDCEGSQTHANRYMEQTCFNTSFSDKGVELDWLKAFWDVRTNGGVELDDFVDWLFDAYVLYFFPGWSDPYFQLDTAADDCGTGCGDVDDNWDVAKTSNGIDW